MKAYFKEDDPTLKVPIKMWADEIESGALEQAKNLAKLPFVFKHIAILPDCHQGYGMPIGGVIACENVIIPNAVGVDIGCGMLAAKTNLSEIKTWELKEIMGLIRKSVPVGFEHNKEQEDINLLPNRIYDDLLIVNKEFNNARTQIGTLGGGNHFIEIQKGSDGFVWIMIHSGSRNLGKQVADYYNKLAIKENEKWFSMVPKEHELAFFPLSSEYGEDYHEEMKYCVEFAKCNRMLILKRVFKAFQQVNTLTKIDNNLIFEATHNYARMENHFGKNVIVHRKGATSAKKDEIGIIPGSQGSKSYIVKGLGNQESFMSCSHGAGRKMSRSRASKELDLGKEIEAMDKKGIIHGIRHTKDLDEAPGAYKDIDAVMENQKDLVEIIVELKPLAVIKG